MQTSKKGIAAGILGVLGVTALVVRHINLNKRKKRNKKLKLVHTKAYKHLKRGKAKDRFRLKKIM